MAEELILERYRWTVLKAALDELVETVPDASIIPALVELVREIAPFSSAVAHARDGHVVVRLEDHGD